MPVIGMVTCKDAAEANQIADALLAQKLIVCANILPSHQSKYRWKGNIEEATETLMILKTRPIHMDTIISEIKKIHSYELPAVEFIEIKKTDLAFEQWINTETKQR